MSLLLAYEFQCDKTLSQMLELLRADTPWHWHWRESDMWDDYLSAGDDAGFVIKIFKKLEPWAQPDPADRDRFHFEMKFLTAPAVRLSSTHVRSVLHERLAPLLDARDVQPTSAYDR